MQLIRGWSQRLKKSKSGGPSFLILGAAKAGTTTLFKLLNSLPGFSGAPVKETRYFSMDYYYHQGPDWYHAQFDQPSSGIKFEATPHYLYFPTVPERVFGYQRTMRRDMKFIVLLREPVARSYSAWNMERSYHQNDPHKIINEHYHYYNPDIRKSLTALLLRPEFPSFQQAVEEDLIRLNNRETLLEPSYVRKGIYSEQLTHWLQWFDIKKFLFIEMRELSQPLSVVKRLGKFLGVNIEPNPKLPENLRLNIGNYPPLSDDHWSTTEMLKKFYSPYNEKLFRLIGQRFDWND